MAGKAAIGIASMAASINDRAVAVRLAEYSETSQVVSFFTERHGQTRLIAKGIKRGTKKRFAPGVDLLELGELSFVPARSGAGLGTLTGWLQIDTFGGLRLDLSRLYAGLYVAELLSALTEESDPHTELFRATVNTLRSLGQGEPLIACLMDYQESLLRAIGYVPEMERCLDCGQGRVLGVPAYFSSAAGGLICRDCEMHHYEKRPAPPPKRGENSADRDSGWFGLYDYHLRHIAGKGFKTADQLLRLLGLG